MKLRLIAFAVVAFMLPAEGALAYQPVSGISSTEYNEGTDKAASFYNPLAVSAIDLTLPPASFNELNNNPYTKVYQTASVTITTADGVVTSLQNIGVRIKGQATRTNLYGKTALKLKFDEFVPDQKFKGLTRMTLNSMMQDPSFVHENMAYRLYRAMGVPASRSTYSWVTVNGADFGLYANLESVDSQMVKRWMDVKHIYSSDCYLQDLDYYQSCFDTNYGDDDRSDLNAAIAVSNLDGQAWWNSVNQVADMTAVINLMATDLYTSNWDGYTDVVQNNYYVAFDLNNKLKIIPWGQDGTYPMDSSAQLDWLGRGPAFRGFGRQQRSVMLRKCVAYDPCQNLLVKAQVQVKIKAGQLELPKMKDKIASVINNAYIAHEPRSNSYVPNAVAWQNWLDTFFTNRNQSLTSFLNSRAPVAPEVSLSGTPTVGSTLTADASTWDFTSALRYEWYRDGSLIVNQQNRTYTLTKEDQDHFISVKATATKYLLPSASTTSQPLLVTGPVPPSALISGSSVVGGLLSASPNSSAGITASYKWYREGKAITGALGATYLTTVSDFQKRITVTVTLTERDGTKTILTSPAVTIAAGSMTVPALQIAGENVMGKTLSAVAFNTATGVKTSYVWLRAGNPIPSATRSTYTLKADDTKREVTVRATFTKTGYSTITVTATGLTIFEGTLLRTPTPSISGTYRVTKILTLNTGTWDAGTKLTYQWLRNGVAIQGAISKTYKLTSFDQGTNISATVTGSKLGFTTVTKTTPSGYVY